MPVKIIYTIAATDEVAAATNLVFENVVNPPSVTPYYKEITLTIGAKVYTFAVADLLELSRKAYGS